MLKRVIKLAMAAPMTVMATDHEEQHSIPAQCLLKSMAIGAPEEGVSIGFDQ